MLLLSAVFCAVVWPIVGHAAPCNRHKLSNGCPSDMPHKYPGHTRCFATIWGPPRCDFGATVDQDHPKCTYTCGDGKCASAKAWNGCPKEMPLKYPGHTRCFATMWNAPRCDFGATVDAWHPKCTYKCGAGCSWNEDIKDCSPDLTARPTALPTATPSAEPTSTPTAVPTSTPTAVPTSTPTAVPTEAGCNCSGVTNAFGGGGPNCSEEWCYTAPGACADGKRSGVVHDQEWSYAACNAWRRTTVFPTSTPSAVPTADPTPVPSVVPTAAPTAVPTALPTRTPSAEPSMVPTSTPTDVPTAEPTPTPSIVPTEEVPCECHSCHVAPMWYHPIPHYATSVGTHCHVKWGNPHFTCPHMDNASVQKLIGKEIGQGPCSGTGWGGCCSRRCCNGTGPQGAGRRLEYSTLEDEEDGDVLIKFSPAEELIPLEA